MADLVIVSGCLSCSPAAADTTYSRGDIAEM